MSTLATPEGTRDYAERFSSTHASWFRPLGRTGLTVSAVGFGGYRVRVEEQTHREALVEALSGGCNLIDTSTNYGDGASEELVRDVLRQLIKDRELRRDQVVVVTKAGTIQGETLRLVDQAAQHGRPFPGVVEYAEDRWHCIHPRFLEDQLTHSLTRLGLEAVDVLLLHNPEYFLLDAERRHPGTRDATREAYYRRLDQALQWLAREVKRGRIGRFGISSNGFPLDPEAPAHTALDRVLELQGSAPDSGFEVVQLPINLIEHQAATALHSPLGGASVLQRAQEAGLAVLANRPLNALAPSGWVRLADVTPPAAPPDASFSARSTRVAAVTSQLLSAWREATPDAGEAGPLAWLPDLCAEPDQFPSLEHWVQVRDVHLRPGLTQALRAAEASLPPTAAVRLDAVTLHDEIPRLLDAITDRYRRRAQARADALSQALFLLEPELARLPTLSQRALLPLVSLPEVSVVLVGMRRAAYVDDVLALAKRPPLQAVQVTFQTLAATDPLGAVLG